MTCPNPCPCPVHAAKQRRDAAREKVRPPRPRRGKSAKRPRPKK